MVVLPRYPDRKPLKLLDFEFANSIDLAESSRTTYKEAAIRNVLREFDLMITKTLKFDK